MAFNEDDDSLGKSFKKVYISKRDKSNGTWSKSDEQQLLFDEDNNNNLSSTKATELNFGTITQKDLKLEKKLDDRVD